MAHLLPLVASLLILAGTHASDMADRTMHQGFLSQYMGSSASQTSLDDYNKLVTPRFNHMKHGGSPDALSHRYGPAENGPANMFDKSAHPAAPVQDSMAFTSVRGEALITQDFNPTRIVDKEEERAVQKALANDHSMPIGMSAIGVSLLMLAAMLVVRMRRGLQQATAFAGSDRHESDMSLALTPAAAGNILELKAQESIVRGQVGWSQQSSKKSPPMTFCYATAEDATYEEPLTHDYKRSADHPGAFSDDVVAEIDELIALRKAAKKDRDYATADALREELSGCYDVYVDDATREWRAGAPPEPEVAPAVAYDGPMTGGFAPIDEEAEWERRYVPAGKSSLDAQRKAYFDLDGPISQIWAHSKGRDFFVGRVRGSDAQAALRMQFALIDWSARELHLPLGASRSVAYFVASDDAREDIAAWEATPGREAQPILAAPDSAVAADSHARTAEKVGFLAAKSPLPPTNLGNMIKKWKTKGQSASDITPEMRPTGSAAGNTGRAKR